MDKDEVQRAVDIVTGRVTPTEDERDKLIQGDEKLMAVLRTGFRPSGHRLRNPWGKKEPPMDNPRPTPDKPLRRREKQVARLALYGLSTQDMARELHLSTNTVQHYSKNLRLKTGEHRTWQAALTAVYNGWLEYDWM